MILNLDKEDLYLVKCSGWQVAVSSDSHEEACTQAVTHMLKKEGDQLSLSCVIISANVSKSIDFDFNEEHTMFHASSKILANAGFHNISKNLKQIFGT